MSEQELKERVAQLENEKNIYLKTIVSLQSKVGELMVDVSIRDARLEVLNERMNNYIHRLALLEKEKTIEHETKK